MLIILFLLYTDINKAEPDGFTAIMYSVARREMDMISLLLQHGADISVTTRTGATVWTLLEDKNEENGPMLASIRALLESQGHTQKSSNIPRVERLSEVPMESTGSQEPALMTSETKTLDSANETTDTDVSESRGRRLEEETPADIINAKSQMLLDFALTGNLEQVYLFIYVYLSLLVRLI
jgi:ankyrin repeat protein